MGDLCCDPGGSRRHERVAAGGGGGGRGRRRGAAPGRAPRTTWVGGVLHTTPRADVVTVIATFRRPEGLVDAVRSALAQGVDDHLIVVVDDGGGLPDLPVDPRVLALSLARNYGCLGMVRNVGI